MAKDIFLAAQKSPAVSSTCKEANEKLKNPA